MTGSPDQGMFIARSSPIMKGYDVALEIHSL